MASTINPTKSKNNDAGAQSLSTTTTDAVPSTSTTKSGNLYALFKKNQNLVLF
jgi:hypothetical protein